MKMLLKFVAFLIVAYLVIVFLAYLLQSKLLFHPTKLQADFQFSTDRPHHETVISTPDGETISGLFFPAPSDTVILYFHGNAGSLEGWQFVYDDFASLGYNFLIIDYRGYGKSTGTISEKGFYIDAQASYDYLIARGFKPQNIVVYGRSIGSGVAVDLAAQREVAGLVLESPYVSIGRLASEKFAYLFPSLYLRYRFDNLSKINNVKAPLLVIHGQRDELIPFAHGQTLYDHFKGKKQIVAVADGHHNDLSDFPQFYPGLRAFLKGHP